MKRLLANVTIISIWTKAPEIGRPQNFEYAINVTAPVGTSTTDLLEIAFSETNRDSRPHGNRCCSTTAGDIMILDGQHCLVAGNGYTQLTFEQSLHIQKLTSRDTSFGLAFMIKHCGVPAAESAQVK